MKDINLLPEEIKSSGTYQVNSGGGGGFSPKNVFLILIVIVFIGVSIGLPVILLNTLDVQIKSLTESLQSDKYNELKTVESQIQDVNNKIASKQTMINNIELQNMPISDVLELIKTMTPKDCHVNHVYFNTNGLVVNGKAKSLDNAQMLFNQINKLGQFVGSPVGEVIKIEDTDFVGYGFSYTFFNGKKVN